MLQEMGYDSDPVKTWKESQEKVLYRRLWNTLVLLCSEGVSRKPLRPFLPRTLRRKQVTRRRKKKRKRRQDPTIITS